MPHPSAPPFPGYSRRQFLLGSGAAALSLGGGGWARLRAAETAPKRVLFFSKCSDFVHAVIDRQGQPLSYAERILAAAGPAQGIEFTFSKDGSLFSADYLAQFDAICFFTSGDLLAAGKPPGTGHLGDGNPPMTPAGKDALLAAIAGGKGFIGIHSAADTFHSGETATTNTGGVRTGRYRNLGENADPYIRMLGGELIVHGMQQVATLQVVDHRFPGFTALGPEFSRKDEWYSMRDFGHDLHVLLVQETAAMTRPEIKAESPTPDDWIPYVRPPYPATWARMHGQGRVFYTSMGHGDNGPDTGNDWDLPVFRNILFGGMAWAAGHLAADVTPNIEQVTPGAWTLPPRSGPVAGLPKLRPQTAPAAP
jgi:type 1 glutamine amidotransferase